MARKDSLKKLKDALITRRKAIRLALNGDLSLLKQIQQETVGDLADFALDAAQDEISSQLAEIAGRELAQIEVALERFEEGDYGKCQSCDSNIPLARLQALPYATMCIECQRTMEESGNCLPITGDWSNVADAAPVDDIRLGDIDMNLN